MQINGHTLMRDVYQNLIGQNVVVYTLGHAPLGGKLVEYNGVVLHLTSDIGIGNTYIPTNNIVAVCGDK